MLTCNNINLLVYIKLMLLQNGKVFFFHIPRVSGSNCEKMLGFSGHNEYNSQSKKNIDNWFGWDRKKKLMLQHATYEQVLKYNNENIFDIRRVIKLVIIRNPICRAYSLFRYFKRHKTFDEFLTFLENGGISKYFYMPQYKYVTFNDNLINCFQVRYENFIDDMNRFKKIHGLGFKINFNVKKHENTIKTLDAILNEHQIDRIKKLYAKDFEIFKYTRKNNMSKVDYVALSQ